MFDMMPGSDFESIHGNYMVADRCAAARRQVYEGLLRDHKVLQRLSEGPAMQQRGVSLPP